jgi:hypothetical protein
MKVTKLRDIDLTFVSVFVSQFCILGTMMRLDPDPHHDGILYGAAVSVSNGGFPNRDAFAQYGPLIPELQGLWLRLFGPSLINIRFQALCVIVLASMCIWYVAKFYFSKPMAYIISSTWALTIPSILPWPTAYTTLIAIFSLLAIVNIKDLQIASGKLRIFVAGSLIAIGTFGRIHLWAIFILISIYFAVNPDHRRKLKFWLSGFSSTLLTILLFLQLNDALTDYLTQCIAWPILHYGSPDFDRSYIVGLFWYPIISGSFLMMFLFIFWMRSRSHPNFMIFVVPLIVFLALLFSSRLEKTGELTLRNPRVLLIDYSKNMMNSLDYAVAFFMLIAAIHTLIRIRRVKPEVAIAVLFSAGILTQLYPMYDVNHLWLIAPLLIISSLIAYGKSNFLIKVIRPNFVYVLPALLTALVLQIFAVTSSPRVNFDSPSLQGMLAPTSVAEELDKTLLNLELYVKPKSTSFDCLNGIYAGAGGNYLSSSHQFVNWGPDSQLATMGESIFLCAATDTSIRGYITKGYRVVFQDPLTLYGESEPRGFYNVLLSKSS